MEWGELREHIATMVVRPHFAVFIEGAMPERRSATIASLEAQLYPDWLVTTGNRPSDLAGIEALRTSSHVVWLQAGDVLPETAFYHFASRINAVPDAVVVYGDDDVLSESGARISPFFKPDWSPDYFECFDYVRGAACIRLDRVMEHITNSSCFWDFALRATEGGRTPEHIRKIVLHRPCHAEIASEEDLRRGIDALNGRLARTGRQGVIQTAIPGQPCYQVNLHRDTSPLVSVVIPTAGKTVDVGGRFVDLLTNCIESVLDRSSYRNFEFVVVHDSDFPAAKLDWLRTRSCRTVEYAAPGVNIAMKMNLGVAAAEGEYVLLLNDDIEPIAPDWIERMLDQIEKPHIGAVGAKLLYPSGLVQHVGVVLPPIGPPQHASLGSPGPDAGYGYSSILVRNWISVTGACVMTRRDLYMEVGGFTEKLAISYNDIDYCLKLRERGYEIVVVPQSSLYHLESASRIPSHDPVELLYFESRWSAATMQDPFYNHDRFGRGPADFRLVY